jgi:hypothetical protein
MTWSLKNFAIDSCLIIVSNFVFVKNSFWMNELRYFDNIKVRYKVRMEYFLQKRLQLVFGFKLNIVLNYKFLTNEHCLRLSLVLVELLYINQQGVNMCIINIQVNFYGCNFCQSTNYIHVELDFLGTQKMNIVLFP